MAKQMMSHLKNLHNNFTHVMRTTNIHAVIATLCALFAFTWLPAPEIFNIVCILLIIVFIPTIAHKSSVNERKDPLIKTSLLFFTYIVISIIWHRFTLPEHFPPTTSDRQFLRVLYFIAIAYAITNCKKFTPWLLLTISFIGLVFYLILNIDSSTLMSALQGERVDFGIHNAQHTGIVFSVFLLVFSAFYFRFFNYIKKYQGFVRVCLLTGWLTLFLFSLWGVLVSQTRAVWIALALAILCVPLLIKIALKLQNKKFPLSRRALFATLTGISIASVLLMISFDVGTLVQNRAHQEKVTWESLRQAATYEKANMTSFEIRIASWSAATEWIAERPWMGWGGRGSRPLIRHSEYFSESFKKQFNHLHNSYLQTLVEIGVLGASFIIALIFIVGKKTIQSCQQHNMPIDVFIFSWLFFIFWAVVNIFESYMTFPTGVYFIAVIGGFTYSFCIKKPDNQINLVSSSKALNPFSK